MSLVELLPAVRSLPHLDKLRLLQFLVGELAREEGLLDIRSGAEYPIWSPHSAYQAATILERTLLREWNGCP